MKFGAKASSSVTHLHRTVLTHVSINKDDYYTAHFQPGDLQGAEPWRSESVRGGWRMCLIDEEFTAWYVMIKQGDY